ncbi:MAG: desulfoferrodoxin [Defluviitaleaceae bacterium]|nr:desulfoferrodoxin [Defluviitaleaceae bacterium]
MNGKQKFFICEHCGNLIGFVENKDVPLVCCGLKMEELIANTVEASTEKHLPNVKISGNEVHVEVGSVLHPMEEGHHIKFIYVETECGGQRKSLKIGADPIASFCLVNDKPVAIYEYCNLHGLWKTEM